jgi:phosphoribosylanthranilate isomerase
MVDVSGGVENSPGLKDECMLADFVESVKLADISAYA